jgi:flavin reductase (DIM6/NTAB) family NADH-FMN oxidoreductase RutF
MSQNSSTDVRVVDQDVFRDVIGRFASGVTVITTKDAETDHGTTASAVSSLSMDPPMILVCLNRTSSTQAAILGAGVFAVNILAEDQGELAYRFAKKGQDKFAAVPIDRGVSGVPLLRDALAHIECEIKETVAGGTHTVFLAQVVQAAAKDGPPLTYFRGRFGRLENALEEAAYRELRDRVVSREIPAGRPLDLEELARNLDTESSRIFYALTKLSGDGLVSREDGNTYVVKPLTSDAAEQIFDARCAVEIAVVDRTVGTAESADLDELEDLADTLARVVASDSPDLDLFLKASHTYHARLVGLAKCSPLTELYDRLGIPAFWHRTVGDGEWWRLFDVVHHAKLVEAYRHKDSDRAKELIYEHAEQVKHLARTTIDAAGGQV